MKNLAWNVGVIACGFVLVAVCIFLSRAFTTATVGIQLERVSSEVVCAKIVTTDGAALSCWKE